MSQYDSNFRQPPWVIGSPKEVMDWINATYPSEKKKAHKKPEVRYLNNLHIRFDFDVKQRDIQPSTLLSKVIKGKMIEEDFELLPTAELILRGLAKAKFRNTAKIAVDKKVLYKHPEKKSDLRKTIEDIGEFSNEIKNGKQLEINAILDDVQKSTAIIKIYKIHKKQDYSVDIQIKGKIREDIYHIFMNYLKDKIGLKK